MRWLALIVLLLLGGCGGFVVPTAAVGLEFSSVADLEAGERRISARLLELGFDALPDQPHPDFMLEAVGPAMQWRMIHESNFSRERGGLLDHEHVRVELTPYPDATAQYQPYAGEDITPRPPFLEVRLLEYRPDGFSQATMDVQAELLKTFATLDAEAVELSPAIRGSDQAYLIYRLTGLLQYIAWWITAWVIYAAIIAWPLTLLVARFVRGRWSRRAAFVAIGALFATPIPVPTMFITVPLPNILLIWPLETYARLLSYYGPATSIMFASSICLSTIAAMILVRRDGARPLRET